MVGEFSKDKFPGEFMDAWRSAISPEKFDMASLFVFVVCHSLCVLVFHFCLSAC